MQRQRHLSQAVLRACGRRFLGAMPTLCAQRCWRHAQMARVRLQRLICMLRASFWISDSANKCSHECPDLFFFDWHLVLVVGILCIWFFSMITSSRHCSHTAYRALSYSVCATTRAAPAAGSGAQPQGSTARDATRARVSQPTHHWQPRAARISHLCAGHSTQLRSCACTPRPGPASWRERTEAAARARCAVSLSATTAFIPSTMPAARSACGV